MTAHPGHGASGASGPRLPHLPALDGLRGLAIVLVLLYHADLEWMPGGFLGVECFFVLSGYLITSLLLAEWSRHGRLDLMAFWRRRARRLFPALAILLVVVTGYAVMFLPRELATLRGDVLSTAAYVANWHQVLTHQSYFEAAARPPLLRHMWSLAIEEQFYLVWPLLFSALMARLRPRAVLGIVVAGALASMLAMAALYQPNADVSRIYYGTDTRAAGLLLGAALAFVWRPGHANGLAPGWMPEALGVAGFGTLVACGLMIHEFEGFLYRGGFCLAGLATAELIVAGIHPGAVAVPRALSWTPLCWVGLRSYGIYLWHFPVFMVTRPKIDVPFDGPWWLLARMALTLLIAALSYRFVELPIRHGALGRWWHAWRHATGSDQRRWGWRWAAVTLPLVAACSILGIALLKAQPPAPPPPSASSPNVMAATPQPPTPSPIADSAATPHLNPTAADSPPVAMRPVTPSPPAVLPPPPASGPSPRAGQEPATDTAPGEGITAIGDSVMEGVAEDLKEALGTNLVLNTDRGRLPWNTAPVLRNLRATGKLHPTVILHIGNNGFLSPEVLAQILSELNAARRIVVVNLRVPRRWESPNNRTLASILKSHPNAVLADWHRLSDGRLNLFWSDGVHLRPEGARLYAGLIAQAVGR
ncbi:MAG: acyltransferase [Verrucomicrobia bacterium]|nr:acyltransferase [Verrucomicrobiota bacterium]